MKAGAEVKVIMTDSAREFVSPLTFSVLSKNDVYHAFTKDDSGQWNHHVDLGIWADAMVIAPLTANTLAKMNSGICDNLLMAVYLSARCPVFICPAMDLDMWAHESTQKNISGLKSSGVQVIYPATGELASGLSGEGRMEEPENILLFLNIHFSKGLPLTGKKALVTAGPTYEEIDPVRFIGNRSTGKMGYAIAEQLAQYGAVVTLITGPTILSMESTSVRVVNVETALQMFNECRVNAAGQDIIIMAAAVADYRPEHAHEQKMKKKGDKINITLVPTDDILLTLGKNKEPHQLLVGFALETENELENARKKMISKNLDMIILNSLNDAGAGFGYDTNKITILGRRNDSRQDFPLKQKQQVAKDIADAVVEELNAFNINT